MGQVVRHGNAFDDNDCGVPDTPRTLGKEKGNELRRHGEPDHGIRVPLARMASDDGVAFMVRARVADDLERLGPVRQNERGGDAGEAVVDRAAPATVGRTVGLTLGTACVDGNDSRQLEQRSTQTVPSYTECDRGGTS